MPKVDDYPPILKHRYIFECSYCPERFKSFANYMKHLNLIHSNYITFKHVRTFGGSSIQTLSPSLQKILEKPQ